MRSNTSPIKSTPSYSLCPPPSWLRNRGGWSIYSSSGPAAVPIATQLDDIAPACQRRDTNECTTTAGQIKTTSMNRE